MSRSAAFLLRDTTEDKLGFIELLVRSVWQFLCRFFQKATANPTRVALVASAEGEIPRAKKRHGGVRGTTQVGGSPLQAMLFCV